MNESLFWDLLPTCASPPDRPSLHLAEAFAASRIVPLPVFGIAFSLPFPPLSRAERLRL